MVTPPIPWLWFTQTKLVFYLILSGSGQRDSMPCVSGSRGVFLFKELICSEEMGTRRRFACVGMSAVWLWSELQEQSTVNCMLCCPRGVWQPPRPCCVSVGWEEGQSNRIQDRTCPVGRWNLIMSSYWKEWDFWESKERTNGVSNSSQSRRLSGVFWWHLKCFLS